MQEINQTASNELSVATKSDVKVEKRWIALILSTRRLLLFVFMSLIFIFSARSIVDPDFWWHLKAGEYIFLTNSIPRVDIFSGTFFGKEWVAHEWLSELLMYAIYRSFGYGGLITVFSLIITATLWAVYKRISRRIQHPLIVGPALLLGALASAPTWGVRPQMLSFLFTAIFIALLESYARKAEVRKILWLVPLMVLWVNLHAGYAMGLAFILLMAIGIGLERSLGRDRDWQEIWRALYPLCVVFGLCLLAVLVNPNGSRLYSYPFETLKSPAMMKYIAEWHSPDFHQPMFQPLALLFFAVVFSIALSRRRVRFRDLLFFSVTGWATLKSARNVPFFVLVAVPMLAEHCFYWLKRSGRANWINKPERPEGNAGVMIKVGLNILLLIAVPVALAIQRVSRSTVRQPAVTAQLFPVGAAEHMVRMKLPEPMYNEYGWGGYLIWRLSPTYRVHIDGRADVYGDAFLEEFLKTHAGEGNWHKHLADHNIKSIVIRSDAPLANLLRGKAEWRQVFDDSQAVIFVRQ